MNVTCWPAQELKHREHAHRPRVAVRRGDHVVHDQDPEPGSPVASPEFSGRMAEELLGQRSDVLSRKIRETVFGGRRSGSARRESRRVSRKPPEV
jgi:hypothetical protein